jgi:prophage regulatory protein
MKEPKLTTQAEDRMLPPAVVFDRVSLSRTTVWRLVKRGEFPAPIPLTAGRHAWSAEEVQRWIADKKDAASVARSEAA